MRIRMSKKFKLLKYKFLMVAIGLMFATSGCSASSTEEAAPSPSASSTASESNVIDCRTVRNLYEKIVLEEPKSFTAAWELNILTHSKIVASSPDCFSPAQLEQANAVIASHKKNFRG